MADGRPARKRTRTLRLATLLLLVYLVFLFIAAAPTHAGQWDLQDAKRMSVLASPLAFLAVLLYVREWAGGRGAEA